MRTLCLALWCVCAGCVHSYAKAPPLEFDAIPYTAPDGSEWPVARVALPKAAAKYGLGAQSQVAYVELNPSGTRTLLFLHGLGSYSKFWREQLNVFANAGYRVLAFDQLGFGKSDKPARFSYLMESMAETAAEFLEVMKVPRAVVVGHSMGGEVALAMALRFPQQVEALVLTSPAGFEKFSPKEKAWFEKVFSAAFVKSAGEYAIRGSIKTSNFRRWRPELEWLIEERVRLAKSAGFDAYAYAQVRSVNGLTHNDFIRDNLEQIHAPTLILFGEDDRLIPNPFLHGGFARTVMQAGAARIEGAQLEGLAGCGHTVQMDCPSEYNPKVLAFLSRLSAADSTR
jgi:pimeloyl-ACP methyl ester carboxylesterase